jgi:hypothetical protein
LGVDSIPSDGKPGREMQEFQENAANRRFICVCLIHGIAGYVRSGDLDSEKFGKRGVFRRRSAARGKKFFEEQAGEALGIVADDGVLLKEVIEDDAEAKLIQLGEVDDD